MRIRQKLKGHNLPVLLKDFYKSCHYKMYPFGTELIFSNFTPRKSRMPGVNHSVFFGLRYFVMKYLIEEFNTNFFEQDEHTVCDTYRDFMKQTLGIDQDWPHIRELHQLGHLPIEIRALPEGTVVPCGVPALVMWNTDKRFYWLTNMLETLMSAILWGACTSATTAHQYRQILDKYAAETSDMPEFVDYQAHDFSFRGMFGLEAAALSGAAHLQYFKGTDTIPAILLLNDYYGKDLSCGTSVPATEHSVACANIFHIEKSLKETGQWNGYTLEEL